MSNEHRELPPDRLWQPATAKWFLVVFGASVAYAVIRYHLVGDVEWRHFPLFVLNKATSLAVVVFVAVVAALVPLLVKRNLVHEKQERGAKRRQE